MQSAGVEKSSVVLPSARICILQHQLSKARCAYWGNSSMIIRREGAINHFLLRLQAQQEEVDAWYCKPGQKLMTEDAIGSGWWARWLLFLFCEVVLLSNSLSSVFRPID